MPTIEEMIKILKANGYSQGMIGDGIAMWDFWCIGDICFITEDNEIESSIKAAYAHYRQQERYQQMEALLKDLSSIYDNLDILTTKDMVSTLLDNCIKAKAILAEKEAS